MKYLFFDIECANCFNGTGKICEFGYVLTDEQFNVIDKKMFLINPKANFDWYVVKNLLTYDLNIHRQSPDYKHYFKRLEQLFTDEDIMIFGHTVEADIKYLNDEAVRYKLPFFDRKFYDVKYLYNTYAGTPDKLVGVPKYVLNLELIRQYTSTEARTMLMQQCLL